MGVVEIQQRYVGRVIGTKGSNLKQLEADLNVSIRVSREQNHVSLIKFLEIFTIHFYCH